MAKEVFQLTRRQMQVLRDLRENETIWFQGMRRTTRDLLCQIGVAYESDAGTLNVSRVGRRAVILTDNRVMVET